MNAYSPIGRETATAEQALMVLEADHPDFTEDDARLVIDSETDLEPAFSAGVRGIFELEAVADAALALSRRYKERAEQKQAAAERWRADIREALERLGMRKLVLPEATVSIGRGQPGVTIVDEKAVPIDYKHAAAPIEAAFYALHRASALARTCGHQDTADELDMAATGLVGMFLPDRKKIAAALKAGEAVPGCAISNGSVWLTLRQR
jgi:hypothetical protein